MRVEKKGKQTMKKILIMAAVIVAGVAANAASFNWKAGNVYGPDGNKYTGEAVLYATGVTDALYTTTVSSGAINAAFETSALTVGTNYDFYFVIESGGKKFTSDPKSASVQATSASNITFGNMATATQNASNWQVVPEPTSGLMLLLGVAGLALKRKRA